MPLRRQLKSRSLEIALLGYVKNMFKISVLFDTFSDIVDTFRLLSDPNSDKNQINSGRNGKRLTYSDLLDGGCKIWRHCLDFLCLFFHLGNSTELFLLFIVDLN